MNLPNEKAVSLPVVSFWINGAAVSSTGSRWGEVSNPAEGKLTKRVPFANAQDIDTAVKAASAALVSWGSASSLGRAWQDPA